MAQTTLQALAAALSGLSFRNNLNTILAALFSASSGPTAPSPTVGGQYWFDNGVSPPVLRVRNNANTAWLALLPETIPANTIWGNLTGAAAAPTSFDMTTLLTALAAQPLSIGSAGKGQRVALVAAAGNALVLPAGNTWDYWYQGLNVSGGGPNGQGAGVSAGGTTVASANAGINWIGTAKRVS